MYTRDKVLFNYLLTITCCLALTGCFSSAHLPDSNWTELKETYRVKGSADFARTHRVAFGPYQSSAVSMELTETTKRPQTAPVASAIYPTKKKGIAHFSLNTHSVGGSDVRCWNGTLPKSNSSGWKEFAGYRPVQPLLENAPGASIFCAEIVTSANQNTWRMMIASSNENNTPCGFLLRDDDNYYTIIPVVQGSSSIVTGYLFKNRADQQVAAVNFFDRTAVELGHLPEDEKFLLANAAASILVNYFMQVNL